MSKLNVQAFGPKGLRGFNVTGRLNKAELVEILERVPADAERWTEWTSASIVATVGQGKKARRLTAFPKNMDELREGVARILAEI